jgi:hypothetical protein
LSQTGAIRTCWQLSLEARPPQAHRFIDTPELPTYLFLHTRPTIPLNASLTTNKMAGELLNQPNQPDKPDKPAASEKVKERKTKTQKKLYRREKREAEREAKRAQRALHARDEPPFIEARDIVDWLLVQNEAPHPLNTSVQTMLRWVRAANSGITRSALNGRIGEIMRLWRAEGDETMAYTHEQQERCIAVVGEDARPPIVTITWQQFQQTRQSNAAQADPSAINLPAAATVLPSAPSGIGASTADPKLTLSPLVFYNSFLN